MLDAGSTGSRIHVFEFDYTDSPRVKLVREVFKEVRPGLSKYGESPKEAADSLRPLMDIAIKEVPRHLHSCTPVELKATAGLRLLGQEKSERILTAVESMFRTDFPFSVKEKGAVIVMDGRDEGPFAWLTINFLLGSLNPKETAPEKTAAIIDMGGASTQIVFVAGGGGDGEKGADVMKAAPKEFVYSVSLPTAPSFTYRMYTHSHLGYGLKEAGKQIMSLERQQGTTDNALPCQYEADGKAKAARFDKCLEIVGTMFPKSKCEYETSCSWSNIFQPRLSHWHRGPLFAFSYYFDRLEHFFSEYPDPAKKSIGPEGGEVTVGFVKTIAQNVCEAIKEPYISHAKGTMCMDLTYLYALLNVGYQLDDALPIQVRKKINDVETAWPLGAMILAM